MDKSRENANGVLLSGLVADSVIEALFEHVQVATDVLAERDALATEVAQLRSAVESAAQERVTVSRAAASSEAVSTLSSADKVEETALAEEVYTLKAAVAQRDRRIRELISAADEAALLRAEKLALEAQVDEQQRAMDSLIAEVESLRAKLLRASSKPAAVHADA